MIESSRTRWIIIFVALFFALALLVPNFVDLKDRWWLSKDKIVYGLDIQGGLHLVMGVDSQEVVKERLSRMAENMKLELSESGVAVNGVSLNEKNQMIFDTATPKAVEDFIFGDNNYAATLQHLGSTENQVTVAMFDTKVQEYKKQVVDQAIEVIRNRIDGVGVSEPNITAQGDDRIMVQLPGIEDSVQAKELINKTARLEFMIPSQEVTQEKLEQFIDDAEKAGNYALGKEGLRYTQYVKRLNKDLKGKIPEKTEVVFQKSESAKNLEAGRIPFLMKNDIVMGGDVIDDARVGSGEYGNPVVSFDISPPSQKAYGDFTGSNVDKPMAIVLDKVVKSVATINSRISRAGQITLSRGSYDDTFKEAQFISTTLRAGALPAALTQLEERTVGPTLGKDSIDAGKLAGLIGGLLVILFMLFWYRKLGFVANIALSVNVLFILALLTSLGATLTLPGIAGIVLTVGMAVDANVIIFERIKEELAKGSGLKTAVKDGFGHALSAIIDANITTAAVCFVLMYFGTGPVRGFAVTLLCGIATSMFTAIFVSRSLIDFMVVRLKVKSLI